MSLSPSSPNLEHTSSELRGRALEKNTKLISRTIELNSWYNDAVKYNGWKHVLGGSTDLHINSLKSTLNDHSLWYKPENNYKTKDSWAMARAGFAHKWNTGVDLDNLVNNRPIDRWKYYLSMDLSTAKKQSDAIEFASIVLQKAKEQKLSFMSKSEDHNYDSWNIYTWDPDKFDHVVNSAYQKFPDIWLDVKRPFQAEVLEVPATRIAKVNEPINGLDGSSHTTRMGFIGKYLDENVGFKTIEQDQYVRACRFAGVIPETPWVVDPIAYEKAARKI